MKRSPREDHGSSRRSIGSGAGSGGRHYQVTEDSLIVQQQPTAAAAAATFVRIASGRSDKTTSPSTSHNPPAVDGHKQTVAPPATSRQTQPQPQSQSGVAGFSVDCLVKYLRVVTMMSSIIILFMTVVAFGLLYSTSDLTTLATFECIYLAFQTVVGFYAALYGNPLATLVYAILCGLNFVILMIVLVSDTVSSPEPEKSYDAILRKITWALDWTQLVQCAIGASIWVLQ